MMEAEIFQDIADAIQNRLNRIKMPVENDCPIHKILWSSFDYMAGPELLFIWEKDCSKARTSSADAPVNPSSSEAGKMQLDLPADFDLDNGEGAVSSSDSSFSKNTGGTSTRDQFEDIENDNAETLQLSSNKYDNCEINSDFELDSLTQQSASSHTIQSTRIYERQNLSYSNFSTNTEAQLLTPIMRRNGQVDRADEMAVKEYTSNGESSCEADAMVTSCVDSGIAGTVSMESNMSAFAFGNEERKDEVMYKVNEQICDIRLEEVPPYKNIHEAQEVIEFDHDNYSDMAGMEEMPNYFGERMYNSVLASSQIASSFHSNCSISQTGGQANQQNLGARSLLYKEAELLASEFSPAESTANSLPDEAFVAKQVLAEQIGSIQFTTNPVLHKFCIVPSRHICFGSYIFSTRQADQPKSAAPNLSAFSIILPIKSTEWYLERQTAFQEIFTDIIARFKAAFLVEEMADLICRSTREFETVFLLFGALERFPLCSPDIQKLRIQSSHLWEIQGEKDNKEFVHQCVTACLICRGHVAIVGSNSSEVARLLTTLAAFLAPRDRLLCLKPCKLQYFPYLRLQAIKRSEIYQFFEQAANTHWSSALLDIDRCSVIYTGLYQKHRLQKRSLQLFQISQIFREAVELGTVVPPPILTALDQQLLTGPRRNILETFTVRADPAVKEFMDQICLLPLNRAARLSFLDHFHLRLENRAQALLAYVRDLSLPSPDDKRSALSSKWHLATVRRNLNLQHESAYGIALASADSLKPDFAEFVAQQTLTTGRQFNQ